MLYPINHANLRKYTKIALITPIITLIMGNKHLNVFGNGFNRFGVHELVYKNNKFMVLAQLDQKL